MTERIVCVLSYFTVVITELLPYLEYTGSHFEPDQSPHRKYYTELSDTEMSENIGKNKL